MFAIQCDDEAPILTGKGHLSLNVFVKMETKSDLLAPTNNVEDYNLVD